MLFRRPWMARTLIAAGLAVSLLVPAAIASADPGGPDYSSPECPNGYVALTLDDGPSPTLTPQFVDFLIQNQVPATFFVKGQRFEQTPGPTQRAYAMGFAIGNHTWDHPHLPLLSDDFIRAELGRTDQALRAKGIDPGRRMRSPFGDDNPRVIAIIKDLGLWPIGWTDDSLDYRGGGAALVAQNVLGGLVPRRFNIVLAHDGGDWPSGPDNYVVSAETLKALPTIVSQARAAGYCFTQFNALGHPMIPAPAWTPEGWAIPGPSAAERRAKHRR